MPHRTLGIICNSPGWGGLELNTLRLAGWLQDLGWRVHLLTSADAAIGTNAGGSVNSVTRMGVPGKLPRKPAQLRVIHEWVGRYKIRALLVPYNKDLSIASLYKRFYNRGIGLVYQQHMSIGVRKRDLIHTLRYAMIDVWIAPLQYLKAEVLEKTRVPADRIEVVPFGIDTAPFLHSEWTRKSARRQLHIPDDAFLIGVLGRLDPKKGQDTVVEALAQLRRQGVANAHLLLMGASTRNEGDAFAAALHRLVASERLGAVVDFRPYESDVMLFFRAIDVFVMPSHGETYGMVTVEAMAAGVPVIGTDKDGTAELLDGGRYGRLFPVKDSPALAALLKAFHQDAEMDARLAAAKAHVIAAYDKNRMATDIAAILEEVILENKD
jgi:glycosyltransferase involved in cell wall biosynthesis